MTTNRKKKHAIRAEATARGIGYRQAATALADTEAGPNLAALLGIDAIDTWDPRPEWTANQFQPSLTFPIGVAADQTDPTPVELAIGGESGTGVILGSGITGFGKSVLLTAAVTALIASYGPTRLELILTGRHAHFQDFADVPHVVGVVDGSGDGAADQLVDVIDHELQQRETLLVSHDAKDGNVYRAMCARDPGLPPLPDLLVVIDELWGEEAHAVLRAIMVRGQSLGVFALGLTQYLSLSPSGALLENVSCRIALRSRTSRESRLLIGSTAAETLGQGEGIVRRRDTPPTRFTSADVTTAGNSRTVERIIRAVTDAADDGDTQRRIWPVDRQ